jgi:hypothetical protein
MHNEIKQTLKSCAVIGLGVLVLALTGCNSHKEATTQAPATSTPAGNSAPKPADPTPSPASPAAGSSQPAAPSAVEQAESPCGAAANPSRCFFSDPFTVSIVNIDHTLGPYHTIRLNIEFLNVSKKPVILAYQAGTGKGVDNLGNGYAVKAVPTGIPTDYGTKTDARLTLQPGEAHMGTFEAGGYRTPQDPKTFNYDFTIDELGTEKPNPVLKEHAVYFRDLTPAMP